MPKVCQLKFFETINNHRMSVHLFSIFIKFGDIVKTVDNVFQLVFGFSHISILEHTKKIIQ